MLFQKQFYITKVRRFSFIRLRRKYFISLLISLYFNIKDLGVFTTQQYKITEGNTDDAFGVKFRRQPTTGVLELDLIVNGNLDRERISMYTLQIVAIDGGTPPRTGTLTLRVHVQDLNDSPPLFSKQRYFTTTSEDTHIGGSVLKVGPQHTSLNF